MEGISPFQSGRPLLSEITADKLNRILAEIKRNRPVVAAPLSARVTGDGTHISIKQTSGGTSTPTTRQPWDLIARVDPDANPEDENPPYLVRVQPGTLNGILPSNWGEEFECAGTGLHYAKAVIATDGEAITGVTIEIDDTPPDTQQPVKFGIEAEIEYLFGLFAEGQVYRVIGAGHITLLPAQWLVISADPPAAPGESPYDIYYVLGP
jgi:hypothetical protein